MNTQAAENWLIKSPPRKAYFFRIDNGVRRNLYTCTFVTENYLSPGASWFEHFIEFYALRPGQAAKTIAAAGAPLSMALKIIN
jgi:hypothetical protein